MELTFYTAVLLPAALGLLGFIEPCTVGGHMLFLETQNQRSQQAKAAAVLVFVAVRALVTGLFGALIAFAGSGLISLQTGMWLVFGSLYVLVGLAFIFGRAGLVKQRISLAPKAWKSAQNPLVLGLAFGLNIPACAAPILFGLLGLAATTGAVLAGFMMMFVFGLFLSLPLVVFAITPRFNNWLQSLGNAMKNRRWLIGTIFVLLGLWAIWFGLYVDPADWSGR